MRLNKHYVKNGGLNNSQFSLVRSLDNDYPVEAIFSAVSGHLCAFRCYAIVELPL